MIPDDPTPPAINQQRPSGLADSLGSASEIESEIEKTRKRIARQNRKLIEQHERLQEVCPHNWGVEQSEGDGFCRRCRKQID